MGKEFLYESFVFEKIVKPEGQYINNSNTDYENKIIEHAKNILSSEKEVGEEYFNFFVKLYNKSLKKCIYQGFDNEFLNKSKNGDKNKVFLLPLIIYLAGEPLRQLHQKLLLEGKDLINKTPVTFGAIKLQDFFNKGLLIYIQNLSKKCDFRKASSYSSAYIFSAFFERLLIGKLKKQLIREIAFKLACLVENNDSESIEIIDLELIAQLGLGYDPINEAENNKRVIEINEKYNLGIDNKELHDFFPFDKKDSEPTLNTALSSKILSNNDKIKQTVKFIKLFFVDYNLRNNIMHLNHSFSNSFAIQNSSLLFYFITLM